MHVNESHVLVYQTIFLLQHCCSGRYQIIMVMTTTLPSQFIKNFSSIVRTSIPTELEYLHIIMM
jgi:hypothetical protein